VVAVPADIEGGEDEIKACIVLKAGGSATHREIIAWCESRMPYFAVPRYLEFLESFPRTPSEKVQKNLLRAAGKTADTWDRVAAGVKLRNEDQRARRRE
jgi:crotonobetaine/carnitine-CoA ligase